MRVSGKQTKRAVSLLLCLTLLVTMMALALTVRAEEADEIASTAADSITYDSSKELADTSAAGDYIYCKNTAGWSTVYAYMWNKASDGNANAGWPGVKMTNVSGNIWRYQLSTNALDMIIFSENGSNQTGNMEYPGAGYIYDNSSKQWSVYEVQPTTVTPTTVTPTTVTPTTPQPTSGSDTGKTYVYCENEAGWSTVTAYMWISGTETNNASWPGKAMTNIGGNTWRYEVTNSKWDMIIFSNNGADQTSNLNFPGKNAYWFNKTKVWDVYDTNPLRIDSFETDTESPVYDGVAVTLSAAAEGENQSTVYYKFSIKNSSGTTTVLKDFNTANSVQWIPQTAGAYTLIYDFKDAKGNTNNRTKSFVVEDGSSVVAPFIKTVTPFGGDIPNNQNTNIIVSAGGGKTGTNLLFYKYTIKNPSGEIVNTPYYTKNTSYTFKPTVLGLYTATVDVQGSDNKTVQRSYILNSVGSVAPTDPPATEPPVQPTQAATQPPTQPKPTDPPVVPTEPVGTVTLGDADDDGDVTILDVTYIQRYDANIPLPSPLNERNADVDGDEDVTIIDATYIQRLIAGIIKIFPALS